MCSRCTAWVAALMLCIGWFCVSAPEVQADGYDLSALETSFAYRAKNCILPRYQDYVLESIKYHLASSADQEGEAVADNLVFRAKSASRRNGNVIFFFDGCSINLEDAAPCFSGFRKDGERYNVSAVCIVVRLNAAGNPEIVFATANASTIADNLRSGENLTPGLDISITRDGIYPVFACNHTTFGRSYAALRIGLTDQKDNCVRLPRLTDTSIGSYYATAGPIDIHARSMSITSPALERNARSSTGCFNVGRTLFDSEYLEFIRCTLGAELHPYTEEAGTANVQLGAAPSALGYCTGDDCGTVIVDRSCYLEQLAVIVGDDAAPAAAGGMTGAEIAEIITARSAAWHRDVLDTLQVSASSEKSQPAAPHSDSAAAEELPNYRSIVRFAAMPSGRGCIAERFQKAGIGLRDVYTSIRRIKPS